MDRQQRDDIKAIQQMARWTLVMLQKAEQGLLPPKVLHRIVDPEVVKTMGPFQPHRPGNPTPAPRVGRLRVQLVHDALAHVACVAPRPDGTPAAYVLEFRKPVGTDGWRITELTRAEERRLVRPQDHARQPEESESASPRRLPQDLTTLIAATRQARAEAAAALKCARTRLRDLPDPLTGVKTNTVAQRMKRDPFARERAQAQRDIVRWQDKLTAINQELQELHEVQETREIRQRVLRGDPLMRIHKWEHLDRLLGPVPTDPDERAQWRHAASTVETYRDRWHITDPHHALGALPADPPPEQHTHHQTAAEIAKAYTAARDQTPRRTQDVAEGLELTL